MAEIIGAKFATSQAVVLTDTGKCLSGAGDREGGKKERSNKTVKFVKNFT